MRYGWYGWDTGKDVSPPEPGKEWLTITEDGDELAVIVLRTDLDIFQRKPKLLETARLVREDRARFIVNTLNEAVSS